MSLSVFQSSSVTFCTTLPLAPQPRASYENRLYENTNGTLEIMPKTPAEVFGERVLRPLIDQTYSLSMYAFQTVQDGFLAFEAIFSRAMNVLPTANAQPVSEQKSNFERCVEGNLAEVYRITQAGVANNDPQMLEAAHKLYGPFFEQCISDETYNKMRAEHDQNSEHHAKQIKTLEEKLDKCEQVHTGESCYKYIETGRRPTLEKVKSEDARAISEWKAHPGYLCWSIYVNRWLFDKFFASGGYNCDIKSNKPTI